MSEVAEFFAHVECSIILYRSFFCIYIFFSIELKAQYFHEPTLQEPGLIQVDFVSQEETLWHPSYLQAFDYKPGNLQQS